MEMICSHLIAQVELIGEIKIQAEEVLFGLKVSLSKIGILLAKDQACKSQLFHMDLMISIVLVL
jgi:hypothetical protein